MFTGIQAGSAEMYISGYDGANQYSTYASANNDIPIHCYTTKTAYISVTFGWTSWNNCEGNQRALSVRCLKEN